MVCVAANEHQKQKEMREIKFIVIHCTASPQTQSVDEIRRFWRRNGWQRPGYHRIISPDGTIHNLSEYSQTTNGVRGHNSNSIHISYIGGVDANLRPIDNRTEKQKAAMLTLVQELNQQFPQAVIQGHRDFSPDKNRDGIIQPNEWIKACPSFSVRGWLDEVGFKAATPLPLFRTTTNVNIRTGAGVGFSLAGNILPQGTIVKKIGENGAWTYVEVQPTKLKGWVNTRFLQSQ